MRLLFALACPDDELRRVSKVSARNIWRRIGLCPSDAIQNLVSQLRQAVGNRENVMVSAADPDSAVILQLLAAHRQPLIVEIVHLFWSNPLILITLIHAYHLARLTAYSSV